MKQSEIASLARAQSLQEALSQLRDGPFEFLDEIYRRSGDLKLAELHLLKQEIALYSDIARQCKGAAVDFTRALVLRYEIDNLKNALRLFFDRIVRNEPIDNVAHYILYEEILHHIPLDRIVNADSEETVLDALKNTPYRLPIEDAVRQIKSRGSLFAVEMALDRWFYKNLLDACGKLSRRDAHIARRLIGIEIDLANINNLLRLKNFYGLSQAEAVEYIAVQGAGTSPDALQQAYESGDNLSVIAKTFKSSLPDLSTLIAARPDNANARLAFIEELLDRILLHEVSRQLASYPFTIGIILAYFILKSHETKRIRTILNAKFYAISRERLEEML